MLRPEDRLQVACAKYLRAALPPHAFYSGIEHAKKQSLRAGQVQKAKGVKRGLADLNIWCDRIYLAIELKTATGRLSDAQKDFGASMIRNGFAWRVARSVQEVDAIIRDFWPDTLPSMRIAAMQWDAKLAVPVAPKGPARKPLADKPSARKIAKAERFRRGVFA